MVLLKQTTCSFLYVFILGVMISGTHSLWQCILLHIGHTHTYTHTQMASDVMVKVGKTTITFPALNDLEEAGQNEVFQVWEIK